MRSRLRVQRDNGSGGRQRMALCLAAVGLALAAGAHASPFRNTTNERFRARCNGPQGAIVIPDGAGMMRPAAVSAAVNAQHNPMQLQHAVRTLQWMQANGLKSRRAQLRFPREAVHVDSAGQLVLPDLMRVQQDARVLQQTGTGLGAPTNDLTFNFTGWDTGEEAMLRGYLATAYPKAKTVYGPPAFNLTVNVIKDRTIAAIQGGIYDVTKNEIHMGPLSGNTPEDTFILLFLVLQAFHDDASFFFDAWEQGFAGAAATAIQTLPGVAPGFSPIDPGPFYALSVYEAENQPELGNPTFFPASGFSGMLVWRIALARAAWMKCWIEDNNFFSNFNQQYYAQFDTQLPGDVPRLTDIGEQVLPSVEGMPFKVWFQQQYVLDTSATVGPKLFTWNIPLTQSVALICEHYFTDLNGDESPRGGTARTDYLSFDFTTSLFAEEGNLIQIPASGDGAGEGFLIPTFFNVGGAQRITVQVDLNNLERRYPYPYNERGFEATDNNLYGAILNNDTGSLSATGGSSPINGVTVNRGVWGGRISTGDLSPAKVQITYTNPDGAKVIRQVNVGYDSYIAFLNGGGQTTAHLGLAKGTSGLYMISLPVTPLNPDASAALGISSDDLLLARWDPRLATGQGYRLWPLCDPLAAGRGFWIRLIRDIAQDVPGVLPATDSDFGVPLELGWNQIGSPRQASVALTDLKVAVGDTPAVAFQDAVTSHLLQNGVFGFTQAEGYKLVETLDPYQGYWIRCLSSDGVRLVFPGKTPTTAGVASFRARRGAASAAAGVSRPQAAVSTGGGQKGDPGAWRVHLQVASGGLVSSAAYIGQAAQATDGPDARYDIMSPPAFGGPATSVRFTHTDWGKESGDYVSDIRPLGQGRPTWEMRVESTVPGADVRLTWPDLSSVPKQYRPVLVDEQTGLRTYMRTAQGVSIPGVAGQTVSRRLRIELVQATESPGAQVTSLMASRTALGVSVVYTLSAEAQVTARVLNISGRVVRLLATARSQPAGQNVLLWNLRSDRDSPVPAGAYLLEMQATTPEGQVTRVVRTMIVSR